MLWADIPTCIRQPVLNFWQAKSMFLPQGKPVPEVETLVPIQVEMRDTWKTKLAFRI